MEWDSWDGAGSLSRRATGSQCGERGWGNWLDWPGRTPRPQEKESGTGWRLWETLCSVTEGVGLADVGLVWVEPRAGTDEAAGAGSIGEFHLGHFLFILAVCRALCGARAHAHTHRHTIHMCTHGHTRCMHVHTHTTHTCNTHPAHMHLPHTHTHAHIYTMHHTHHVPHTHTHTHTIVLPMYSRCVPGPVWGTHTQTHTPCSSHCVVLYSTRQAGGALEGSAQ